MEIAIIVIIVVIGMVVLILKSSNTDTDSKRVRQGYIRTPEEKAKYDAIMRKTNKLRNNDNLDKIEKRRSEYEIESEIVRLQSDNKAWSIEAESLFTMRKEAQVLEKLNKLDDAICVYLKAIDKGEKSSRLNIYNYAHDINRVIILYGKTKQLDILVEFLKDKINKHPDFNGVNEWSDRLKKSQIKK